MRDEDTGYLYFGDLEKQDSPASQRDSCKPNYSWKEYINDRRDDEGAEKSPRSTE